MKLKNFNWNEQSVDQVMTEDTRYTTYTGYGTHEFSLEAVMTNVQAKEPELTGPFQREELTSL